MLILPTILMPDRYFLRQTRIELAEADVHANSHIWVHSLIDTPPHRKWLNNQYLFSYKNILHCQTPSPPYSAKVLILSSFIFWDHPLLKDKTAVITNTIDKKLRWLVLMIWEQNVSQSKRVMIRMSNKMAYTAKDPCPPQHFLYLTETKSWRCEDKVKGENVHLLTHTPARDVGKNSGGPSSQHLNIVI